MMPSDSIRNATGSLGRWLFTEDFRPRNARCVGLLTIYGIFAALIFGAATTDHVLRLPTPGRGLLDHYGFQACFLSSPLVLMTTYVAVACFLRALGGIDALLKPGVDQLYVTRIITRQICSLFTKDIWRSTLGLFIFIGMSVSIAIFRQLSDPVAFWGNDVFNALRYHYSFIVANLFLFITWGLVYPVAFYAAIHMTISVERIIAQLKSECLLRLDFLHVDRCGGMARFGTVNFMIMLIYLWPLGALYALHLTHRYTYFSLILGALGISIAFVAQSVYGIYWVSRAITAEQTALVTLLNQRIEVAMNPSNRSSGVALAMLAYRDRVLAVKSLPYSTRISLAVNFLRFAPAILASTKGIVHHL